MLFGASGSGRAEFRGNPLASALVHESLFSCNRVAGVADEFEGAFGRSPKMEVKWKLEVGARLAGFTTTRR